MPTSAAPSITSASRTRSSCSARESTSSSWTGSRDRMRASSYPTWPTPNSATTGRTASGSSSTLTTPPQHWRPCSLRACGLSCSSSTSGSAAPDNISSRARATAVASRLPPPTLPQLASRLTTILAPASRGAWPRTSMTVTSTPGCPSCRSCCTAPSQSISHLRVRPGGPPGQRRVARGKDRPVDGFRRGRAGQRNRPAGRPERADRLAERLAHAERLHQRRLADRLRAVHHARFCRPLEQVHVELRWHLGEARDLVGARRLGVQPAPVRPVGLVPEQFLQRQPSDALHETALDLAQVDQRGQAVADVVLDFRPP